MLPRHSGLARSRALCGHDVRRTPWRVTLLVRLAVVLPCGRKSVRCEAQPGNRRLPLWKRGRRRKSAPHCCQNSWTTTFRAMPFIRPAHFFMFGTPSSASLLLMLCTEDTCQRTTYVQTPPRPRWLSPSSQMHVVLRHGGTFPYSRHKAIHSVHLLYSTNLCRHRLPAKKAPAVRSRSHDCLLLDPRMRRKLTAKSQLRVRV